MSPCLSLGAFLYILSLDTALLCMRILLDDSGNHEKTGQVDVLQIQMALKPYIKV